MEFTCTNWTKKVMRSIKNAFNIYVCVKWRNFSYKNVLSDATWRQRYANLKVVSQKTLHNFVSMAILRSIGIFLFSRFTSFTFTLIRRWFLRKKFESIFHLVSLTPLTLRGEIFWASLVCTASLHNHQAFTKIRVVSKLTRPTRQQKRLKL